MESFQRPQVDTLVERLAQPARHIIALFGPRQTGKTTIAIQALGRTDLPSRHRAVDEPDPADPFLYDETALTRPVTPQRERDTEWLVRQWEEARLEAERSPRGSVLVLDEIQKIEGWSEVVKGLWDADRLRNCPLRVVILGSAPLLMQSGLSESLAGRFETMRVNHWSFAEMSSAFGFDLPQYLYFGGYPGAAPLVREPDRWRAFIRDGLVEANIERDLLAMTRVDKPALLKQLFELGADCSGQILAYNKMLGQLHDAGNTTTLARYLDLLAKVGLLAGLKNFSGSPVSRRGSIPKLNVLNTALMTADSAYSFEEAQADRTFWGRIVESAVGAHLFNTAGSDMHLYYWRDGQHEVDFVLKRGGRVVGIEVKSGKERQPAGGRRPLPGMAAFEKRFKRCRCRLVGEGGTPLNEFLSAPAAEWFEEAWA